MAYDLVTGATGFIGTHFVAALAARGTRVRCLVRASSSAERKARLEELGAELVEGDVSSGAGLGEAVAGADTVYHLAGATKALSTADLFRVNEQGVARIAEACAARQSPPVLVIASSLAAAGPSAPQRPRIETEPARPVSRYGESKRAGEQAAERFAGEVPITIVRPPIVVGEWDRDAFQLFSTVARGWHPVPWGAQQFSLIHAADLAEALIDVAARGRRLAPVGGDDASLASGYYFVSDEEYPTFGELGRRIARALGRSRVRVVPIPHPVLWMAAAAGELSARVRRRPQIFTIDKYREARVGSWACSAERIRSELGFAAARPLDERLRQTAEWYQKEGWL